MKTHLTEPVAPSRFPLAMWALTGTLETDRVLRFLDSYQAANWGVVLYPRWGLEIEYLSDRWFEKIRFIVKQAAARNVEVWLYDEFCWPSGQAKGLVTENSPQFDAEILEVDEKGNSRISRIPKTANLLSKEATHRFLSITHDRYAAAVGEYFGSTIRAIFTDEPSFPHVHEGRDAPGPPWRLPWSSDMDARLGGDFRQRLVAENAITRSPLWKTYWSAYTGAFHQNWIRPISEWCQSHGLLLTGHLLGEDTFGDQVMFNGNLRRQLSEMGIPGIDEIRTEIEPDRCEALTLATIAEFKGRERMAEIFALGPTSMSLNTMQAMVNLCASCGVSRFVHALSPLDFRGNIYKSEYFSVFGPQQPWFQTLARPYSDFCVEAADRARTAAPLGIPFPSEDELWELAGPDPGHSAELKNITDRFVQAAREAIKSRLETNDCRAARKGRTTKMEGNWHFRAVPQNSLRIDQRILNIDVVPSFAELSVQKQLVSSIRINGHAIDLEGDCVDPFDSSYARYTITPFLEKGPNTFDGVFAQPEILKNLPAWILWGDFAVNSAGTLGTPVSGIKSGDWREQGYPSLCGTGRYEGHLECEANTTALQVDSGGFPVRLVLNGFDCGFRTEPPFSFEVGGRAKAGRNSVLIEIVSTIGHLFAPEESAPIGLMSIEGLTENDN